MRTWLFFVQVQLADPSGKKKRKEDYVQIGDVPRIDQRLDDEPIVRRLPKIRPALPSLRLPRLALGHAPHKNILNTTPSPQRIKLFRIIHRTAKLESLADRPIVLRPICGRSVDRHRVRV